MTLERQPEDRPAFDITVPERGYAWWYVDALSEDGETGLTIIALLGSVFSPYYAWSGWTRPLDHVALNVVLYNRKSSLWSMTERGEGALARGRDELGFGRSRVCWAEDALQIDVDEVTAPFPRRLQGVVRLRPDGINPRRVALDGVGEHAWWPIAPRARVEVEFAQPSIEWKGTGYLDSNWGNSPLEEPFRAWNWSRAPYRDGAAIFYDVQLRSGGALGVALGFDAENHAADIEAPPMVDLPVGSIWRVPRATRADAGAEARVRRTLEDTPFYTRSVVDTRVHGTDVEGVHESLSLDRFKQSWVRTLLPFRMPRRGHRR